MSKSDLVLEPGVTFAHNVDWNLFKIFYEIARRGGIGAAARAVNKQQPNISSALQRLEAHVGATHCTRTSRGIELTIHGHQLFAACRQMFECAQNMPRAASAVRGDIAGTVALRVISNLHQQPKLTEIFDRFHRQYPRIEIKLDVAPWRDVLRVAMPYVGTTWSGPLDWDPVSSRADWFDQWSGRMIDHDDPWQFTNFQA